MSIRLMTWVWAHSPYAGERLLLHLALADFANDEGVCFPSHSTLAKKARCSTGWVSQTIKQMIADSLIEIIEPAGQGRGKVGRYRLLKGDTECDHTDEKGHTVHTDRSHSDDEHTIMMNRQEPSNTDTAFDRLWAEYPRKTAKGAARRSFDRVMQRDTPPTLDDLIAAVQRYASQFGTGKTDLKFCAHLATWLNGERWLDELVGSATAQPTARPDAEVSMCESMAAAYYHTRRPESELIHSLTTYSPTAQAAALAFFRRLKAGTL